MPRFLPLLILFGCWLSPKAQAYRVYGKVTNTQLEPLPLVSIEIKGTKLGTLSKQDGTYELLVDDGAYELVFSMVGYAPQTVQIFIRKNLQQNVILEESAATNLSEVVIKGKAKDRAEEIIRQVIRHKEQIKAAPGAYSSKLYIKAVQQTISSQKGSPQVSLPDTASTADSTYMPNRMAMAEVLLHLDFASDQHIKEERIGVKKRGNTQSLFYLSTTEGQFNFYNNLVKVPSVSETPFLSPVSYSGLVAYRYKTIRIQNKGTYKEYTISVKPTKLSNATVEGELTVTDSAWAILHTHFTLPAYHLAEYDFFEVEQEYQPVEGKAWMLQRQQFTYRASGGKRTVSGQTEVHYSDYQLNQVFPRNHFGVEISATAIEAYKHDSSFWNTVRAKPLTPGELRYVRYTDSVYRVMQSKPYLDSIDRRTNQVTWRKLLFTGQTFYNREKQRTIGLPSLPALVKLFGFGGVRFNPSLLYMKTYPSRKNLYINADISYGFQNRDINGNIHLTRMYNPFNRGMFQVSAGRDFQPIFSGDAWINMLKRSNYYLNNYLGAGHSLEVANGLFLFTDAQIALRRSLSGYKTSSLIDSTLGDILDNNKAIDFSPYNAFYGKIQLEYTPKQRYIREPLEKVILGSAWPTFYASWRKGVPGVFSSKVDFDFLEFGIKQTIKVGLVGTSRYTFKTGTFLNKKSLRLVDYHFQRRGDPLLFLNPDEAFQALDSTFPVFKRTYQAHYVHDFNGFFINKIPLLKKLGLREMAGAGFLIAPERNLRYAEVFAGLERVLKWPFDPLTKFKLGVYVVGSAANKFQSPVMFKIGITSWNKRQGRWY